MRCGFPLAEICEQRSFLTLSASSHESALAESVLDKYTNKFKILAAFRFRMLVSRRGKKVVILLQKLELELVISDCNVNQQQNEMIETRTRCVAISDGGKICYQLFGLLQRPFGQEMNL